MSVTDKQTCRVVRPRSSYTGKQALDYVAGISAESAGALGISMHLVHMPAGGRGKAHEHASHETAIYMLRGTRTMLWGERLENRIVLEEGDMLYIPAGMPHLPVNEFGADTVAVVARTDPNEQESIVLRPDLDGLVPAG